MLCFISDLSISALSQERMLDNEAKEDMGLWAQTTVHCLLRRPVDGGGRDALYRIMATTDCELDLESTGRAGEWASHDSPSQRWEEQEKIRSKSLVPGCKWGLIDFCLP